MRDRAPEALGLGIAALALAAGAALFGGSRSAATARGEEFQRLAGGLGSGSATSLDACVSAFDRGVSGACDRAMEPAPAGPAFCPHHGGVSLRR